MIKTLTDAKTILANRLMIPIENIENAEIKIFPDNQLITINGIMPIIRNEAMQYIDSIIFCGKWTTIILKDEIKIRIYQ